MKVNLFLFLSNHFNLNNPFPPPYQSLVVEGNDGGKRGGAVEQPDPTEDGLLQPSPLEVNPVHNPVHNLEVKSDPDK